MTILPDYDQFEGLHWASGSLRNALAAMGVTAPHTGRPYSEALLMGIGGGICAGYFVFEYAGLVPWLHFLTRYPVNDATFSSPIAERLGMDNTQLQTPNPKKAEANLVEALKTGRPALVWADMATLPYNNIPPEGDMWMMTPLVVYGYDGQTAHLADRARVPLTVSADILGRARGRVGKFKHRLVVPGAPDPDRLPAAVEAGIRDCANLFIEKDSAPKGARGNFGLDAFSKWADLLVDPKNPRGWPKLFPRGPRLYGGLTTAYKYIELYFTGGRGARHIYADFLDEAAVILNRPALREAAALYRTCAARWDDLTAALLPDDAPALRQAREWMARDYRLFLDQGAASLDERRDLARQLADLQRTIADDFPLDEAQTAALRDTLRERVLALRAAEENAVLALRAAMG